MVIANEFIASVGTLVFVDSFSGLIPAKITQAWRNEDGTIAIATKLTASRGAYRRGEPWVDVTGRGWTTFSVVPRKAVYRSRQACGQYRVRRYTWTLGESN